MPDNKGTYTNHWHGDLGDASPGYDQDFAEPHLDDPRIGAEPDEILAITAKEQAGEPIV
jgi:hypothetical protein